MLAHSISFLFAVTIVHAIPKVSSVASLLELNLANHDGPLKQEELGVEFKKIGTVQIYQSNLTGLSKDILNQFTNLENLTISDSNLLNREDNIFASCCPKLKFLEIKNLVGFKEKDLADIGTLSSLERLQILDQDIGVLKSGIFEGTKLKSLSLVRCNIETIEDGAFNNLNELEFLSISNNKIRSIPTKALAHLKNLETLELISNGIEKISSDDLPELPNLTDIVLIRENIKELDLKNVHERAPKLTDVFLIGIKNVEIVNPTSSLKIHNMR